jgi:hypothetical protein
MEDDELKVFVLDFLTKTDSKMTIGELLYAVNKDDGDEDLPTIGFFQMWRVLNRMFDDDFLDKECRYFLFRVNHASNPSQAPE